MFRNRSFSTASEMDARCAVWLQHWGMSGDEPKNVRASKYAISLTPRSARLTAPYRWPVSGSVEREEH
jgi:hypothetical protein